MDKIVKYDEVALSKQDFDDFLLAMGNAKPERDIPIISPTAARNESIYEEIFIKNIYPLHEFGLKPIYKVETV